MGDRTKLCDYTNTPNDQFIAKPVPHLRYKLIAMK